MTKIVIGESNSQEAPIGIVILDPDSGPHQEPMLQSLLVAESQRRKGVATRLLKKAEEKTLELGHKRIHGVTHPDNKATNALFESLGYKRMIIWSKSLTDV